MTRAAVSASSSSVVAPGTVVLIDALSVTGLDSVSSPGGVIYPQTSVAPVSYIYI